MLTQIQRGIKVKNFIKTEAIIIGLAMFSMFFGAGNIIFPLVVGQHAGDKNIYAILGLIVTAVIVPFAGVIAMILFDGNMRQFFGRLGKGPGLWLAFIIIALLGPFGSTPRCIALAYSTLKSAFPGINPIAFSSISCLIILAFTIRKNQILKILGWILTPLLLSSLLIIIVVGLLSTPNIQTVEEPAFSLFMHGLKEGYNTMDLLAAFFFSSSILAILKLRSQDMAVKGQCYLKLAIQASGVGAFLLALVYIGFSYLASFHGHALTTTGNDELLTAIAMKIAGPYAGLLVCIAVALTCLTTAIALISVFADFFQKEIMKERISYELSLVGSLIVTFVISTFEFKGISAFLGPVLKIVYPGLIVLTFANIAHQWGKFKMIKTPVFLAFALATFFYFSDSDMNGKINELGQSHLLKHWESLSPSEKEQLSSQIERLDLTALNEQRKLALQPDIPTVSTAISPFTDYVKSGSVEDIARGKQLIAEGKVGCLIVAGGQGTRLRWEGPKGCCPVSCVKHKTLFQLFAERGLAASKQAKRPLVMAIMTSPANHRETIEYFTQNNFFGLDSKQVTFFSQEELPLLDAKGNMFLETPFHISVGADGNAASLKHFVAKGIWDAWSKQGIRYLIYVHIDNPLADPFDAELIGFHSRHNSDLVIKCIAREDPNEKLGVILKKNEKIEVIEYSEISEEQRTARNSEGTLRHLCGNISMFSFNMDFVKSVANQYYNQLPFHKAWKAVKYLTPEGKTQMAEKPMAWKFEKFIFDVLPFAKNVKAVLYPRDECFAPLKNATGSDSLTDVQVALQHYDRKIFTQITGIAPPTSASFELSPQFYYPTPELLSKWKGKSFPSDPYIEE